jgi:hypothetical protein
MVGKRVQIDEEMWQAINRLRQERRRSFQQLATEALRDLLEKYHRPVHLKDQLKQSLADATHPAGKPAKQIRSGRKRDNSAV